MSIFGKPDQSPEDNRQITNSIGIQLAWVPPGTFLMGSVAGYVSEIPRHQVEITRGFYIGIYQVTQAQYRRVMGVNPSRFSSVGVWKEKVTGENTDSFPVEMVSWSDAKDFCRKVNQSEKNSGLIYNLPTEAEWE